MSATVDEF